MMCRLRFFASALSCLLVSLALPTSVLGRDTSATGVVATIPVKQVGINFPVSASSPDVQKKFQDAVLLLHNFEYDDAVQAFSDLIQQQPNLAMGYWGLAMAYNHPLWGEQDTATAQRILADLDKVPSPPMTPREKGFVDAVKLLYGPGDKGKRDAAYAEAMRKLYVQFPNDDEVAALYGLALLGDKAENPDFVLNVEASDVLERVYARNPNHPGVLHYLVHCYDDPKYASLGLEAADRYELVAADSAHALHMPSHIYLDLGMWKAFIHANEASWAASVDRNKHDNEGVGGSDIHGLHTLQWLEYGYLQQGQIDKARESLKTMLQIYAANPSPMVKWYLAMMRAAYIVNAPDWQDIATSPDFKALQSLDLKGIEMTAPAANMFADGLIAIRQNKPDDATPIIGNFDTAIKATQNATQSDATSAMSEGHHHDSFFTGAYATSIKPAQVMQDQLKALQLLAQGKNDDALNTLQQAVGVEDKLPAGYGPPMPVKPSTELLGEVYLRAGLPQNAMRAFQMSLLRYPNRAASLAGLSTAARLAGDQVTASKAQAQLHAMRIGSVPVYEAWHQLPCQTCATGK